MQHILSSEHKHPSKLPLSRPPSLFSVSPRRHSSSPLSADWPIMPLEPLVHSLSVASCEVLLIEEKTNDEGKNNKNPQFNLPKVL